MSATFGLPVLTSLIAVAILFDFLNGLHDAANSIATVVSTRVLRPLQAVVWAAFFNFIAFLFFGLHVAQTVGTGIIDADIVEPRVIFGALMGAITWNVITWRLGIPSSSSHALIGGLVGAGVAKAGVGVIVWYGPGQGGCRHRALASDRLPVGAPAGSGGLLDVRALDASGRRQHVSYAPAGLGGAVLARARRQRRAEDHGHHRRAALLARAARA